MTFDPLRSSRLPPGETSNWWVAWSCSLCFSWPAARMEDSYSKFHTHCPSVRLSVRITTRKLLIGNWCKLVGICPLQWLDLATSFSAWGYIFRISRSGSSFKGTGLRSRSRQQKTATRRFVLPSDTANYYRLLWVWLSVPVRATGKESSAKWLLLCRVGRRTLYSRWFCIFVLLAFRFWRWKQL